ncbi:MAG: peptidase S58 family protein [Clostridia bacterium]|nr:MAG: peptidase S58 family protein [Clostridia bacterium]
MGVRWGNITDVAGIRVGHADHPAGTMGCTVVLAEGGAVAGVDVRGGAPGTRETDALDPLNLVERVHAVLLAGGSAHGLAAADGVAGWLAERGLGFAAGEVTVPVVPAAVIFDLQPGASFHAPGADLGYAACTRAVSGPLPEGRVGAGRGATVGKILGREHSCPGGVGNWAIALPGDGVVAALVVVNALGEVVGPGGDILAGARDPQTGQWLDTLSYWQQHPDAIPWPGNTTLGVVVTDARLNKAQASFIARAAQAGMARSIRPSHTLYDGDTIFVLATGEKDVPPALVAALAAEAMRVAVWRAVLAAGGALDRTGTR